MPDETRKKIPSAAMTQCKCEFNGRHQRSSARYTPAASSAYKGTQYGASRISVFVLLETTDPPEADARKFLTDPRHIHVANACTSSCPNT